ncbi:UDP-N-acetylmuramoyl-L-alanyl-D-glutamate--2,6-diaminopimelate ligase [Amphritea sp. 1_MG-2023]|uniref:UDP-N-acetylmuramoyl-L-alanyl-D-glutamate--2, 6-diaminopimelate ligase n=1 Tax=Amphritea sp. 1_MG-2023 TaxID=3062670 RepID=UPI0026E29A9F|nr:UDP-N-acetylmuramoyl-L-alanyl-D-glutamate--2,6-diaminopimelate ligase [Amphritea sp. 1_MG-2023]MDO6562882.1 UDP-N-acetylmuramoyl-L-alanyl-D-glutamate--2,6-diaminopimelate ligase [Amphritea sp. 1_MG-2023]
MNNVSYTLAELMPSLADSKLAPLLISGLCQDSRQVKSGDLFFARNGVSHKGIDFVCSAAAEGAVAAIVDDAELAAADSIDVSIPLIGVADVASAIGEVASRFYGEPSLHLQVIGVTGTNGKTSCAHYVAQLLSFCGETCGLIGTVGNGLLGQLQAATHTTPDAIGVHKLLADFRQQGATAVVMEVSSHALDQQRISGVHFVAAGFTNLSRDHLDYHGDMANYAAAKARLFNDLAIEHQVINVDDAFGVSLLAGQTGHQRVGFGESPEADVRATEVQLSASGIRAHIELPRGSFELDSGIIGRFNLSNLLLTIAITDQLGYSLQQIAQGVGQLSPVAGRMALVSRETPQVVIDYAHTPDALEKALLALRSHCHGQLWCVFGCGGDRDNGKRPQMAKVAERLAGRIIVTSDNPRMEDPEHIIAMIMTGFSDTAAVICQVDRQQAIEQAIAALAPDDILLIAGKGHETYQDIQGVKLPFDDLAVARQALAMKRSVADDESRQTGVSDNDNAEQNQ